MIKKTLLTFTLLLFSQACFAVDMQELNTEFFAKFVYKKINFYIQETH